MKRQMMLWATISLAAFATGCDGARSFTIESASFARPQVVQRGKTPVDWTQFSPSTPPGVQYWGIVAGPDRAMWLAELNDGELIRVSMSGNIKIISLNSTFAPKFLAVGADRNLWVTSATLPAKIGRVTTSGTLTTFNLPSGEAPTGGIAAGPDGNVWFSTVDDIGRITPAGQVTEIAYPSSGGGPGGVTAGPDGNVWFTESNHNKIGRIDPATLSIKEFDLSASGLTCNPRSIAEGSDHDLWIDCGAAIAQVTASGTATAFPNTFGFSSSEEELAPGPDGQIWIATGSANGLIAEINTSTHAVTSHPSPFAGDFSNAIVAGPDKNMWVTTEAQGHVDTFILQIMAVTPTKIHFTSVGQSRTITVSEPHTASWIAASKNSRIASVAPGGSADKFVVTAVGPGSTTVAVADHIGNSFLVKVTVR